MNATKREPRIKECERRGSLPGRRAGVEGLLAVRFPADARQLQASLESRQDPEAMVALRNGDALEALRQRSAPSGAGG